MSSPARPSVPSRRPVVRLRRALWRGRHLLLVTALAIGGAVVVHELRPPAPLSTHILVLARDVPAGSELSTQDLTSATVPPALAGPEMMRSADEAVGSRLAVGLPAGFPVTGRVLVGPGLASGTAPGEVVVPVRLADAAVARTLHPGDRVDLMAATADAAASEGGAAVVAAGALVVARGDDGDGGLLGSEQPASLVYVAVPQATAPDVVGASAWSPLRVVLPGYQP